MVDRHSGHLFVAKLNDQSTAAVIKIISKWFDTFGWPEGIETDGGPKFRGEFREFALQKLYSTSAAYPILNPMD